MKRSDEQLKDMQADLAFMRQEILIIKAKNFKEWEAKLREIHLLEASIQFKKERLAGKGNNVAEPGITEMGYTAYRDNPNTNPNTY